MREIHHEAEQVYVHLNVPGDDVACLAAQRQVHLLTDTDSAYLEASDFGLEVTESKVWNPEQPRFQRDIQIWHSIMSVF